MAERLGCMECGSPLSADTCQCPHCFTEYPLGVMCLACCQTLKESQAIKHESNHGLSVKYFHASCYEQVMHLNPKAVDAEQNEKGRDRAKRKWQKNQAEMVARAEAERLRQALARQRGASGAQATTKIIQFLLLAIFAFLVWGVMLSLLFGDIGLVVGIVLAVLIAIPGLRQM
ncbi:MAG: hypothetical protein ACM37W_13370 [Actinomycetota bacterium]